ncbi:MAG: hypothetical protein AAFN74_16205 [Myxococcota bacterium]
MTATADDADKPVVEKLEHGEINWTEKNVMATGSGAPNLKLPNVAAIRLNAERAAELAAYRNIVQTLRGIRISGTTTGKKALSADHVRAQVEGIVKGCQRMDTRYFSDGGVDVVLRCPIDGGLSASMAPVQTEMASGKGAETSPHSGVIIDASKINLKPALYPRVLDGDGKEIYAAKMIAANALRQRGAVAYAQTIEAAKKLERVGAQPLVISAYRLGKAPSDIVVDTEGAKSLVEGRRSFVSEARVVIVTGAQ